MSKQVFGQLFLHLSNLLVSDIVSEHSSGNACVSYFLNILIDTTFGKPLNSSSSSQVFILCFLGVALIYVSLHLLTRLFTDRLRLKGFESGVYGDPPSFKFWMRQAALYLLSLTTMKVVVVTFLALFPGVYRFGEWLLKWTWLGEQDDFQVVLYVIFFFKNIFLSFQRGLSVMGIFPILMNIIQFWLIDSIVKASSMAAVTLDIEQSAREDHEPLFEASFGDEHDHHSSRPQSGRRLSISSIDSRGLDFHDGLSRSTSLGTLEDSGESSKPEDVHLYPPSLSSSMASDASPLNRMANNPTTKIRRLESPSPSLPQSPPSQQETLQTPGPRSMPQTSSQLSSSRIPIVKESSDWADSWDDADEWGHRKSNSIGEQ